MASPRLGLNGVDRALLALALSSLSSRLSLEEGKMTPSCSGPYPACWIIPKSLFSRFIESIMLIS